MFVKCAPSPMQNQSRGSSLTSNSQVSLDAILAAERDLSPGFRKWAIHRSAYHHSQSIQLVPLLVLTASALQPVDTATCHTLTTWLAPGIRYGVVL